MKLSTILSWVINLDKANTFNKTNLKKPKMFLKI